MALGFSPLNTKVEGGEITMVISRRCARKEIRSRRPFLNAFLKHFGDSGQESAGGFALGRGEF